MTDTLTIISDKIRENQDRNDRMDEDAQLAYLEPYKLLSAFDGRKIPGTVSVTMNDPAVYLNSVVSWILSAKWQTFVEGDISDDEKTKIEKFSYDMWLGADERRLRRGERAAKPMLATHICVRGWMGRRLVWQVDEKGNLYLDDVVIDMRYTPFQPCLDGYEWVAPHYFRSRAIVEEQYNIDLAGSQEVVTVVDYWDKGINEVYADKNKVFEAPNEIGYPPFVITPSSSGFILFDKGYTKHEGESIFFLDRHLYKPWNQIVSVDQTLALMAVDPNYQIQLDNVNDKVESPAASGGSVIKTKKGSDLKLVPQPDIKMSNRLAHTSLQTAIQKGGLSDADIASPPKVTSALWITEQTELRNKVLQPLLDDFVVHYGEATRMAIEQYIQLGGDSRVGTMGRASRYKASDLGNLDDYTITYKLLSKSRKQEIANTVVASAARGTYSRRTIIEDICMVDDPEAELDRLESEEAEQFDPVIKMIRLVCSLIDQADRKYGDEAEQKYLEAKRLAKRCFMMIQNENAPQIQNEIQQRKSQMNKQENINAMLGVSAMGNENLTGGI